MIYKNMKIKVETDEHGESNLDEIVGELERLGYSEEIHTTFQPKSICTYEDGTYHVYTREAKHKIGELTTLAELKEM